jgi:hypothetical protein
MDGNAQQGSENVAWDRVGHFFGDMATVTQKVWNRNLTLWSTVSDNIRTQKYGADAMANDAAKAMVAAIDNLDDIWTFLTRVPEREQVASALPTAFLFFGLAEGDGSTHALADPVLIRMPATEIEQLPRRAEIGFSGGEAGVKALEGCLRATREAGGYRIVTYGVVNLRGGTYGGVVYLAGPPVRPLADLRIVVERAMDDDGDDRRRGGD